MASSTSQQHTENAAVQPIFSNKRVLLRSLNITPPPPPPVESLDSSLKKNTAFIKRLKTGLHTVDGVQILAKEARTVSLDKYLSEIVIAINEGLMKCKSANEIWGAVEVISALHQRFTNTFTDQFAQQFLMGLAPPNKQQINNLPPEQKDREENTRIIRQRSLLRCLAEFDLVGLLRGTGVQLKSIPDDGETTFGVLKDLLSANKESLTVPLPLAVSFAKNCLPFYFPKLITLSSGNDPTPSESISQNEQNLTDDLIVKNSLKEKFKKLLCQYFDALSRKAVKDHVKLQELDKKNQEVAIRSGQIFEDRVQNFEKLSKDQEKLWAGILCLSETLSLTAPELPAADVTASNSAITGTGVSSNFGAGTSHLGIWSDEDEKKFYEDIIDLKDEVPTMLLGLESEVKPDTKELSSTGEDVESDPQAKLEEEMDKLAVKDLMASEENSGETVPEADVPESQKNLSPTIDGAVSPPDGEALASGPAARLTALFTRLENVQSVDALDRITVEFAYLNSKAARNRLIRHLYSVNKNRTDLIPYYARMTATLSKYMPDISGGLLSSVSEEFRRLQCKRNATNQDLYAIRTKNIRFIAELAKFDLLPSHSILHFIKVCIDNMNAVNIENICNLLEGCGRWVLKNPPTGAKMSQLLDILKRKTTTQHLDSRQVMMLENAYYQCDPPDRPVIEPKVRTPLELFIRFQLYDVLSKVSLERVIKTLRKLPWDNPETVLLLKNILTKVWKIKYGNIYLFSIVVYDLSKHHPSFAVSIVDQVLENIRFGMELNSFKHNQQRIATIKYLGELYNYRVIDSRVIFDTLWSFVTFGHLDGRPSPHVLSPLDGPDDFFRVRLVCTLLHTCGHCFDRGSLKRRLTNFIKFFMMYLRCKEPPPMDIDFLLQDTFEELRPKLNIYLEYEEAAKAVDEMFSLVNPEGGHEDEKNDDEDEENPNRDSRENGGEGAEESDSDDGTVTNGGAQGHVDDDDEDLPRNVVSAITAEEEEEFAKELAKMVAETGGPQTNLAAVELAAPGSRKIERNPIMGSLFSDQGLPIIKTLLSKSTKIAEVDNSGDGMTFTLLTKKGNKQHLKTMQIPSNASIAVHTRTQQMNNREEHQQLKKLVLDYEQREEANERKCMQADMAKRGINLKFVND